MPGRRTADAVFVLRRLSEKFRVKNKKLSSWRHLSNDDPQNNNYNIFLVVTECVNQLVNDIVKETTRKIENWHKSIQ